MRGQLTIEYIFLALIALALISISIGALLKIREAAEHAYRLELFKSSALDIYNAGEELCAMGSGNSLNLQIREPVSISYSEENVNFSSPELGTSFSRAALCPYADSEVSISQVEIQNKDGEIRIS